MFSDNLFLTLGDWCDRTSAKIFERNSESICPWRGQELEPTSLTQLTWETSEWQEVLNALRVWEVPWLGRAGKTVGPGRYRGLAKPCVVACTIAAPTGDIWTDWIRGGENWGRSIGVKSLKVLQRFLLCSVSCSKHSSILNFWSCSIFPSFLAFLIFFSSALSSAKGSAL